MARSSAATGFLLAVSFLTRLPVPMRKEPASGQDAGSGTAYGCAMAWFPAVGLLIGALLVLARWAAGLPFGPWLASALTLAVWVAVTGGLHLDGAVDAFDALAVAASPERRLAILKDVHVGAYGIVGAVLLLLVKWLAIAEAPWPALLAASVLGRLALVYVIYAFPYARPGGMGSAFKEALSTRQLIVAVATALAAVLAMGTWRGAVVAGVAWLAAWAVGASAARRLGGGITGDIYGLACEVVEVVALLAWGALYA